MTAPTPASTPPPTPDAPPVPPTPSVDPPEGGPAGSLRAVLADLAKERDERQKLQKVVDDLAPLQRIAAVLNGTDPKTGRSEVEVLNERFGALEIQLATAEAARHRAEVAIEKHLNAAQAALLEDFKGGTKEEYTAYADKLLAAFPAAPADPANPPPLPPADPAQGPRPGVTPDPWTAGKAAAAARFAPPQTPGT